MRLMVSGATRTLERFRGDRYLGWMIQPNNGNRVDRMLALDMPWCADNAAFSGFDEARFLRMLDRIAGKPGCVFVAAPDVVADAGATLDLFRTWEPKIRARSLPVALVLQDGITPRRVPWSRVDAVFVGGSTAFKLGAQARAMVAEAKRRGKWAHMGRVNSFKRIRLAHSWGCDSVDGSGYSMFPDRRIPPALNLLKELDMHKGNIKEQDILASYSCALDAVAAIRLKEIRRGEIVVQRNGRWVVVRAGATGCAGGTAAPAPGR